MLWKTGMRRVQEKLVKIPHTLRTETHITMWINQETKTVTMTIVTKGMIIINLEGKKRVVMGKPHNKRGQEMLVINHPIGLLLKKGKMMDGDGHIVNLLINIALHQDLHNLLTIKGEKILNLEELDLSFNLTKGHTHLDLPIKREWARKEPFNRTLDLTKWLLLWVA